MHSYSQHHSIATVERNAFYNGDIGVTTSKIENSPVAVGTSSYIHTQMQETDKTYM